MDAKSLFSSKTFWFNIAAALLQVFDQARGWDVIPQPWGAVIQSAANIYLRTITTQPVTVLPKG